MLFVQVQDEALALVDDGGVLVGVESDSFGHLLLVPGRALAEPDVRLVRRDQHEAVVGVQRRRRKFDLSSDILYVDSAGNCDNLGCCNKLIFLK